MEEVSIITEAGQSLATWGTRASMLSAYIQGVLDLHKYVGEVHNRHSADDELHHELHQIQQKLMEYGVVAVLV
jgi:hypothetical protein